MNKTTIVTLVAGIVVLASIFYFSSFLQKSEAKNNNLELSSTTAQQTEVVTSAPLAEESQNNAQVSQAPAPRTARAIQFASFVSVDQRKRLLSAAEPLLTTLKERPDYLPALLDLGNIQVQAGDYTGARASWQFVADAAPNDPTAYLNLANLAWRYSNDYVAAETYYKKGLALMPKGDTTVYSAMHEMYIAQKSYNKAESSLKEAIKLAPKEVSFYVLLARLYVLQNKDAEAKVTFEAGAKVAADAGQTGLAADINAEASRIK